MTQPRPCLPAEAVRRALSVVGQGSYVLGQGGYDPLVPTKPWTGAGEFADCSGFAASWCYRLPRDRPGFNHGPWATVADCLNTDSIVEDAEHHNELFVAVGEPQPGDLIVNPGVRLPGQAKRARIGHVGLVVELRAPWNARAPDYTQLGVVQCFTRRPAVQHTDARLWAGREVYKGTVNPAWRARFVRAVP